METVLKNRYIAFLLIALVGFAVYSNILGAPFVFDDLDYIRGNEKIRDLRNFLDLSGTRYLGFLSFAFNYQLNGYDTFGYHIVNVALHVLNAALVYLLVEALFAAAQAGKDERAGRVPALAASLLFLTHPVETQAVSYITQRLVSLAAFFYLLTVLLYLRARKEAASGTFSSRHLLFYIPALIVCVAAQKTKEIAATLPFMLALSEIVFFSGERKKRLLYLLSFLVTALIVPLTLVFGGSGGYSDFGEKIRQMQIEEMSTLSGSEYAYTQARVVVTYLRLLVLPLWQNLDYDYPVFGSLLAPQVLASVALHIALIGAAVFLLIRSFRSNLKGRLILVPFGILWFYIALSVESTIIPIQDVIFEHRVYLPSIGIVIAVAAIGTLAAERWKAAIFPIAALAVAAIAINSALTVKRNALWADPFALWSDVVEKSPNKARGYHNLGFLLAEKGRLDEALPYFEKAIAIRPGLWIAYDNVGTLLIEAGRAEEALPYFKKAIELKRDFVPGYNKLANALISMERFSEAQGYLEEALTIDPRSYSALSNLGFLFAQTGDVDGAIGFLERAKQVRPSAEACNNLGNAFLMAGRKAEALREYRAALAIDPGDPFARENIERIMQGN